NFQPVEETALNDMLVTKEFNILTSWMTSEGTVKKEMLQQDEFNILSYIQSRGYADARVRIDIEEVESRLGYPRVDIIITLERGPRYSFGTLSFDGNSVFADEDIHSLFKMEEGGSFSPDAMRDTVRCISDTYGRKGFIDAYVTFEPKLRRSEAVYDVHFHIVEGDQYRVGMIKVYGNTSTYNQVILHETLLIPGEVFNTDKLQKTEQRLRNIGYFECVNVYAVRSEEEDCCDPGAPKFRDVHIEVDERSTGDFTFSFGYSTSEAGFGGLSFSERNFDICGVPCLWDEGYGAIRGGGQYFSARANFGSRNQTYNLSWTEPYWRDTDWAVGVDFDKSHYQSGGNAYAVDAHGAAVHATYTLNQFLKYSWHYRIRHTDVDLGDVRNPSPQLIDEANNSGLISGTGMSLMYDSTNHPAAPSCGFRSRLSAEYVGLGGTHTFFNLGYLNSLYYSPEPCVVMKFRGDARFIAPVGDTTLASLPIDERFFLGGEGSIRGFDHYGIGPRYSNGDPRGGLTLLLCSAEYVWKYFKMADFYTFVDTGTLSAGRFSFEEDWRTSVGLGARLYVFPGGPPLTLGWAWPMNTAPNDKVPESRFFLTLGGRF
ncbi:MAG: outer membrane protein assembly factor BamA, partial [Chlamydiia bacterium]|nr:outer membrane protein assembly factor BamA [Chlamydiia bacterium]